MSMCSTARRAAPVAIAVIVGALSALPGYAQAPADAADTRAATIVAQQTAKATRLAPYEPGAIEALVKEVSEHLTASEVKWHPYYDTAYNGAGFTLGAGYVFHPGDFDTLDMSAAMSFTKSKRAEVEYRLPGILGRRGVLTVLGGWREGLGESFFGIGPATSATGRTAFDFRQSAVSSTIDLRPNRRAVVLMGGVELQHYEQRPVTGSDFEQSYTPETLPGFGATTDYVQVHGTAAIDWRPAEDYARRGGYYGVTARRYDDTSGPFSFRRVDYEVVQHVPVLRDAWVLSLRGRVETTYTSEGDTVPFFILPTLGSGSTLRGFASMRFRDRNSLLLSAEWRVLVNGFVDVALFYDAGKVAERRADLDFKQLNKDYGVGFRVHTFAATPIRVDFARSTEGFQVAFAASAVF